jgi:serine/threonine-protein kinase
MAYMAPEQLLRRTVDRRADVYAAGVTLWEALAGRRLFQATEEPALFGEILEEPVPPPSHSNPEVSKELDEITLRALARDPDRRFDTAREMALALEGVMARAAPSTIADCRDDGARRRRTRGPHCRDGARAEPTCAPTRGRCALRPPEP